MNLITIADELVAALDTLRFGPPVAWVYNPLLYARKPHDQYLQRYGQAPKEVVLVGMNPGPWGMAQTGVPFGEINAVRDWLGIRAPVTPPADVHPRRPVLGFDCQRSEVSGRRLWGWAAASFQTPKRFFERFFVANYCPLLFLDANGRNRTPDKLRAAERTALQAVCDHALRQTAACLHPRYVVGVGRFAEERVRAALGQTAVKVGGITHPSPANPKANRGWQVRIVKELGELGVWGEATKGVAQ
jgi:single-strand selective monofunctional uracil DNA glycosylase